jgi:RNA polymerase sigma-70 factor (ECF subfamily)
VQVKKDDTQLISAYLEGDEMALGVLVDRYLKDVYNFAFKLTGDLHASEDIAQDSFVKAWKNIRKYRQGSNFLTWLFAIARNTAIDWLRQKKEATFSSFENAEGENKFVETLQDSELLPDELLARAEDKNYIETLLTELNPIYREVLTLRYSSNLTFEEIGEILRKPLHTVKSQHRRALIALRACLESNAQEKY